MNGDLHLLARMNLPSSITENRLGALAASSGALHILIWGRHVGCQFDEEVIARAVRRNDIPILSWAIENDLPIDESRLIAETSDIDVVEWVFSSYGIALSPEDASALHNKDTEQGYQRLGDGAHDLVIAALEWRDTDVLRWACHDFPISWFRVSSGLPKNQTMEILRWVVEVGLSNSTLLCTMGLCYEGQGTQESVRQAMECYRQAAAQGHLGAVFRLGVAYYKAEGVERDLKKCKELLQEASSQNHALSQFHLGVLY